MDKQPLALCLWNPMLPKPLVMWRSNSECRCVWGVDLLRKAKEVITYDFSCVLDTFRLYKFRKLPHVIDIQTAKRLCTGKPRSEFKSGHEPWGIVEFLGEHISQESRKWLRAFVKLESLDSPTSEILHNVMEGMATAWNATQVELKEKGEAERFYEIEVPVYNIFLQTELKGIHVDRSKLTNVLDNLKQQLFRCYKRLELDYDFVTQQVTTRMDFEDIRGCVRLPCDEVDFENDFWRQATLLSEHDVFLENLVTAYRSRIDSDALLRYSVDSREKVYPRFDVMGTVTGRIMMPSPGIQYLRKTSRAIFRPAKSKVFLYADFDQFEPGIVASLSRDVRLREIYNTGDVYENLSEVIFGEVNERKLAKTIFLAYLYGMARERLVSLIGKISDKKTPDEHVHSFFKQFKQLNEWKKSLCEAAQENGFAESELGNKRYTLSHGTLSAKERRWIPNQLIQGTASLIFKRALIELHKRMKKRVSFLVPMHDAILIEVSYEDESEARDVITEVFCGEFSRVCPGIEPSVSFEEFTSA